jgi:alkylation response protein AidB-like acyl-CoA dehydrogenase
MRREVFEPDHDEFRRVVRQFIREEILPHHARWEEQGIVDRELFAAAAKHGLIGFNVPEEYGGGGTEDFRFNAVVGEELAAAGATGPFFTLQNDILAPYLTGLANREQKERWLPGFAHGETISAIAMTEPGAGSDLAGVRTSAVKVDGGWRVSGAKTFISSGINADLVVVVARTDPSAGHRGFTLLVAERGMDGFSRGRNLEKMGLHAQDTAELIFEDVFIPDANVLGEVGQGFFYLMQNLPCERLSIAVAAVAGARSVFDHALAYAKEREAFGEKIGSFQHNRFTLAEMDTELDIAQVYVDRCLIAVNRGELSAVDAAKAKWWTTELQKRVTDQCLQLYGGYGYMSEFPISKAYTDARVQTIYGGTTEIMKELIGRNLGL